MRQNTRKEKALFETPASSRARDDCSRKRKKKIVAYF